MRSEVGGRLLPGSNLWLDLTYPTDQTRRLCGILCVHLIGADAMFENRDRKPGQIYFSLDLFFPLFFGGITFTSVKGGTCAPPTSRLYDIYANVYASKARGFTSPAAPHWPWLLPPLEFEELS